MAVYVFTIGGTPREIEVETFSLSETLNAVNTMTIDVRSLTGTIYRPPINDPVVCTEDGTPIFAGLVESAEEHGAAGYGNIPGIVTRVTVKSYYQYLARKSLTVTLPAGTLKSQLTALVALYPVVFGLTLSGSQANGPAMPEFSFTQTRGDEILTALMTAATSADSGTGWVATVDPSKVLRAWSVGTIACPFNVVDGDRHAVGDVTVERTRNDLYANKIFGIFSGAGPATSEEFFTAADGVTVGGFIYFTVKYPASMSINDWWPNELYFDGVPQGPIGRIGPEPNDVQTFAWDWDMANHRLQYTIASGAGFPTGAQVINVKYTIAYPFTLEAVDAVAYAADPWERTIEIGQALNLEAAQALLDGMLDQQAPVKSDVRYQTRETGVHPGQTQTITVSLRDLNTTVLVQEVETRRLTSTNVIRNVSAVPSQVYQGTFRETIAQWMQAGQGNGGVATGAALGALPGGNNRDVQFNDQGAFGGVDGVLIDKDASGDTYGVEVLRAELAVGCDQGKAQLALWNTTAGRDKALTIWQQDDADTYVEFDGNGSGSDLNIFAYGVGTDLNISSPRSLQIVDGGYGAISGGLSYVGLRHLVGVDTLLPGAVRQTSSFTIDSAFAGGGRPECVIYLDKTTSATVTLPVTTADTISVGATDGYNRILFFKNINTGVWALTPASGTIEGASSYSVAQNQAVIIGASVSTGAGWHVLASFGIPTTSGPGSGDVVGPSGATSGDLALFDGSTGKLIKDGSIDTDLKFTGTVLSTQAGIRMVQIDLNNAQIKALPGTPFQLIAAPGANYRVKLIAVSSALDVTAATYSGLDTTYADCGLVTVSAAAGRFLAQGPVNDNTTTIPVTDLTKWLGGSVHNSVMDFVVPATSPVDAASSGVLEWNLPWPPLSQSFTDARDSPVFLSIDNNGNTADLGGGNAANFLRMTLYYAIEFVTT